MKLTLQRSVDTGEETLGKLFLDNNFLCYILEDTFRDRKIKHQTRIPAGLYELNLRTYGGHYKRYIKKFKNIEHGGMIQIMNVSGFTDILIHIGNKDEDTSGCLLVGEDYRINDGVITIVNSTKAYKKIYPMIQKMIKHSGVTLEIKDEKQLTGDEIDKLIKGIEED